MSTTEQDILKADGKELERLLGEVLQPHDCEKDPGPHSKHARGKYLCNTCNVWVDDWEYHTEAKPVYLTWPNAMKWRDWAVKEFGGEAFHQAMWDVCCATSEHGQNTAYSYWLSTKVAPEHYLQAAAIAKLNSKKEQK